jgi:hypothetical protein
LIFRFQLEQHGCDAGLEYNEDLNAQRATTTLWKWQGGTPLQSTTIEEPPMMNTTATTNATSDTNATRATVEEQQQQQQTTSTIPAHYKKIIKLHPDVHKELGELVQYKGETYNDIVKRLIKHYKNTAQRK